MWNNLIDNKTFLDYIEIVANENFLTLHDIYNIEKYYEKSLLPNMMFNPKQFTKDDKKDETETYTIDDV